jgi:hypothetical protein
MQILKITPEIIKNISIVKQIISFRNWYMTYSKIDNKIQMNKLDEFKRLDLDELNEEIINIKSEEDYRYSKLKSIFWDEYRNGALIYNDSNIIGFIKNIDYMYDKIYLLDPILDPELNFEDILLLLIRYYSSEKKYIAICIDFKTMINQKYHINDICKKLNIPYYDNNTIEDSKIFSLYIPLTTYQCDIKSFFKLNIILYNPQTENLKIEYKNINIRIVKCNNIYQVLFNTPLMIDENYIKSHDDIFFDFEICDKKQNFMFLNIHKNHDKMSCCSLCCESRRYNKLQKNIELANFAFSSMILLHSFEISNDIKYNQKFYDYLLMIDSLINIPKIKKMIDTDNKTERIIYNNMDNQYVYLIIEREFIKTKENIYAIGKTTQPTKRFTQYPKGSNLIKLEKVSNCHNCETIIKKEFAKNFIQRKDIGTEYFEGDINDMCILMSDICNAMR